MKLKRTLAFLAALLMTATAFASCSNTTSTDTNQTDGANDSTSSDTTAAVETSDPSEDELGSFDFNGEEQHFYSRTTVSIRGELNVAEETGDQLNDAIYQRNRSLEERFNFVLTETPNANNTDAARTAILAGDDTYDVVTTRCVYAYNYAAEGIVIPIQDIPNVDLNKAYWNQYLTDSMSVLGKKYFAVGDFNLSAMDFTHILLFNKELAENYKVGDLYGMVKNGNWTFDKYTEAGVAVTSDINGDGTMNENDQYGYISTPKNVLPCFWIAAGIESVEKDGEDKPYFNLPGNEFFFDVFEEAFQMHYDSGLWYVNDRNGSTAYFFTDMFANGQSLFTNSTFFDVAAFRSMDADFGILPYPKYDEAQEQYYSRIEGCELFVVPTTNKNTEFTGVVLEAIACESRKSVVPAYYDISLQGKFTRDEESVEMLDIIFDTRVFDWGDTIWCPEVRDGTIRTMFMENDRNLASKIAEIEAVVAAKADETVESFSKVK